MSQPENDICNLCGIQVKDAGALRMHKRRAHIPEVDIKLGEFSITIPLVNDCFTCPITNCKGELRNIDTLSKHMHEQHDKSITVAASPDKKNKKRSFGDDLENFSFSTGAKRALLDQDHQRASFLSAGLGCEPVAVHLKHPEAKENVTATGLFQSGIVKLISSTLPFYNKTRSLPVEATIQLYEEKNNPNTTVPNTEVAPILKDVRLSKLPGLIDRYNYVEPDADLIKLLNYDYRLSPDLLYAAAKLHTGVIVYSADKNLLLLTCEAYCRSKSADVHAETSMKSIPEDKQSLFVGVCEESDGHGVKNKLKIGGYHMNLLSTMSVDLGSSLDINIGPSTNMLTSTALALVYPEENIKEFKATMKEEEFIIESNINHVRQLTSGFGSISTYKPYRASIDLLDKHETRLPATVFNICDFPGNGNYGVSESAVAMLASRFLNIMASSALLSRQNIRKAQFNDAIMMYHANHKDQNSKQWSKLSGFMVDLQAKFDTQNETNGLSFYKKYGSDLADVASSSLSKANNQVKKNVMYALIAAYGERGL